MASLNKVMLIGNLGSDPELRQIASGQSVASFNLATTEVWGGRDGAQKQEKTEWHKIVLWGRLAEIAAEYLRKGRQVYIEGRLQTRQWQDQQGQKRWTTEIVAQQMVMLGGRPNAGDAAEPRAPRAAAMDSGPADPGPDAAGGDFFGGDDDLPF